MRKLTKSATKKILFGRMRGLPLPVLEVALAAVLCSAVRSKPPVYVSHDQTRTSSNRERSLGETKKFIDVRDHFSFRYPASYVADAAAASRWRKAAEARHATAHLVAWLTDEHNGANIMAMIIPVRFSVEYILKSAPTGMEDLFWLRFTAFGNNKFFFYRGGNQAVQHPDQYFYDLNNRILTLAFDGPYSSYSVLPDPVKVGIVETVVLSSLKSSYNHARPARPGSFLYTNARYGFQIRLNKAWAGYEVSERNSAFGGVTYINFSVPDRGGINKRARPPARGRIQVLSVGVQTAKAWARQRKACDCGIHSLRGMGGLPGPTLIGRAGSRVFSLVRWNLTDAIRTRYRLVQVLESFRPLH